MSDNTLDWPTYIRLMEQLLAVPLDYARRAELEVQLTRIAAMAQPLMAFPLPHRQEGAGEYLL
ncbi:TPA: oxalurate catabolism protein HpxX [Kluyvera intermedia]|nr:oxalurate catabolism protein HpxX [Kluyvera intermedia]